MISCNINLQLGVCMSDVVDIYPLTVEEYETANEVAVDVEVE